MRRTWIDGFLLVLVLAMLAACTTSKERLLPHGEATMLDIWDQQVGGGNAHLANQRLLDARAALRRRLVEPEDPAREGINAPYARTAANEIARQFARLPNPDLVMYVFPHLAGTDPVPVPGYTTVFPLYQRVQYALPGERTEDY
jgi:conjugative transfer region lipoprotein (TIGR03751 family)